jgi:nitrite reductase/ring-hydroxylating ferredoxin subunit
MSDLPFHPALPLADLADNSSVAVKIAGEDLLLCRHEGEVFALENRCSHADLPLECGRMRYGWIACPAHGARFDLATGEPLGPPANGPVRTFATRVENGMIEVAVRA